MARIVLSSGIFCVMSILTMASDFIHNSNMTIRPNVVRQNAYINYTNVLNFWEKHKSEFSVRNRHEEVVLVMGNTGSGKTTLISALIGRKLEALKLKNQAYLVIVDKDNKIGTGTSSKTLVPEIMTDEKKNVTYIDCSGFRDNRDIEYEISSIYFQNHLMDQIKKIKLVLVINYESLKLNGNKNDFDDLFEHIGEFIKDISKFHDGIALVVTKVENIYEDLDDDTRILLNDNQLVLNGIADYLKEKKKTYRSKIKNGEMYRVYVDLIDVLLQKKGNLFTRIAIFRQPTRRGPLKEMPKTTSEINTIAKMIDENLQYIEKDVNDFGFALSKSSKATVDQIVDEILRNALMVRLHKMGNETRLHYLQIEQQYSDIVKLRNRMSQAYKVISQIKNAKNPLDLFEEFLDAANSLNIPVSLTNLNTISKEIEKLYFFTNVSNSNEELHMFLLKNEIQNVINLIEDSKNFYDFLNDLQRNLAAYDSQRLRNDSRIANIMRLRIPSTFEAVQNMTDLKDIVKEIDSDEVYKINKVSELNQFRLKHLKAVFKAFTIKLELSCTSSPEKLTAMGYNIRMSDVVKTDCWAQAKIVQVFALNKIFLDCTINKTGAEAQLFIIAPTWEIVGSPKIILDGKTGEPHKEVSAKSSSTFRNNGTHGLPGFPGGPAGHFFGIGKEFINSGNLEISANGGKGGPGQHGGNGADGIKGNDVPDSVVQEIKKKSNDKDLDEYFDQLNLLYVKNSDGYEDLSLPYIYHLSKPPFAVDPSDGGDGGSGGLGGYPGKVVINSLGTVIDVNTSNESGSIGFEGHGGHGGKETSDGRRLTFLVRERCLYPYKEMGNFKCWIIGEKFHWIEGIQIPAGKDGKPGSNVGNRELPKKLAITSRYQAINVYKNFVRMNLFENIKESELRTFIYDLENDNNIKADYTTLAFVKEFEGLENQFLTLRNEIDFVPFYNSCLSRLDEFTKSEKTAENKKVLIYMYTAAFTKMSTLRKKTKRQTVVNLSKYLDIIKKSVTEINQVHHLQIIQKYRDDYKDSLNKKIEEVSGLIQTKIRPEIDKLSDEVDSQMNAIQNEIDEKIHSTNDALKILEAEKDKIHSIMKIRFMLLPLKLAFSFLTFFGPVAAGIGAIGIGAISLTEGIFLDATTSKGVNRINSLTPNLRVMSRVTEVNDNKYQRAADKLSELTLKIDKNTQELLAVRKEKSFTSKKIRESKEVIHKIYNKILESPKDGYRLREEKEKEIKELQILKSDLVEKQKNLVAEKEILNSETEKEKIKDLKIEKKYEKGRRVINHVQEGLNSVENTFNTLKKLENDRGSINKIDNRMSEYAKQIRDMEKMKNQLYDIVTPDVLQVLETINVIEKSLNGSSHAKLDLTKWNVRSTLKDVKSLLQKFTQKMSFELQNNLNRYMEKIDEGFSILIDIYDRIDFYSDSVKQAEYIALIESASMNDIIVTDAELSKAVNELKLIIHSNLLTEKYEIALHAFKQHYFPFAAHVLQRFQLPTSMQLNNTETLRSSIINKIEDMKNHIDESEATIGKYSKYIYRKKVFNSNAANSMPFYVWKHATIKNEVQRLLNGSEIVIKADISKGLFFNAIKYNEIGINFKLNNKTLQSGFTSVLKNFAITMTMIGNNYYRCGERYYFVSFDDDITISYTLNRDEGKNWVDPNEVCTVIRESHTFLSPYGLWSIKLQSVNKFVSFDYLNIYANETMDLELFGQGYYIEQNADFNFDICNEYLDNFYNVENIAKVL